ncbi:hypothetical protein [Nevskia sp.]|uniref:hypothetical protein n=1 Tax=Nevskia sp. TaxID=1929292 RepID=UPI0025E8DBBC|nr:hypothetical protein [Nevskia sp.]
MTRLAPSFIGLLALLPGLTAAADQGWQGVWRVTRDDPRLSTRAGAELLSLTVKEVSADIAAVRWQSGRAICPDPPDAQACEWVGARGQTTAAMVSGNSLVAVLSVSADEGDPFVVVLHRAADAPLATGVLLGARGELRYRIEAETAGSR